MWPTDNRPRLPTHVQVVRNLKMTNQVSSHVYALSSIQQVHHCQVAGLPAASNTAR